MVDDPQPMSNMAASAVFTIKIVLKKMVWACVQIYHEDCKSEVQISMSEMPTVKSEFRGLMYEDTSRRMYGDHDPQALIII